MLHLRFTFYFYRVLQLLSAKLFFKKKVAKAYFIYSQEKYKRQGASIGEGSVLIECKLSSSTKGDRFFIGSNCTLTGVTLLAHDASPTLFFDELNHFKPVYLPGSRSSYRNPITIGNNVFIGWGSIVLPGVVIGSNVVIGAGSIVTKSIKDNSVAVGNPAKVIKTIDEYKMQYQALLRDFPEHF